MAGSSELICEICGRLRSSAKCARPGSRPTDTAAFWSAFAAGDRELRLRHARAGCILALVLMPDELAEFDRVKSAFFANISHDMATLDWAVRGAIVTLNVLNVLVD